MAKGPEKQPEGAVSAKHVAQTVPPADPQSSPAERVADPPPWATDGTPPIQAYENRDTIDDIDPVELDAPISSDTEPLPTSFQGILALISRRRDAKLKVMLEEHVSLVNLEAATRSIYLYL